MVRYALSYTYVVDLSLLPLRQPLVERDITKFETGMRLLTVADEELVLHCIIKVTCLLEDLDIDLQEERQPWLLIGTFLQHVPHLLRQCDSPLVAYRTRWFVRGRKADRVAGSWEEYRSPGCQSVLMPFERPQLKLR